MTMSVRNSSPFTVYFSYTLSTSISFFVCLFCFFCLFVFVFLVFLWVAPGAYGDSQARGPIGAVATCLCQSHSNVGSEPRLQPTPQLNRIVNPLSKGRDRTRNLMVPSQIR